MNDAPESNKPVQSAQSRLPLLKNETKLMILSINLVFLESEHN